MALLSVVAPQEAAGAAPPTAEGRWARARGLERQARYGQAAAVYERFQHLFPKDRRGPEALSRALRVRRARWQLRQAWRIVARFRRAYGRAGAAALALSLRSVYEEGLPNERVIFYRRVLGIGGGSAVVMALATAGLARAQWLQACPLLGRGDVRSGARAACFVYGPRRRLLDGRGRPSCWTPRSTGLGVVPRLDHGRRRALYTAARATVALRRALRAPTVALGFEARREIQDARAEMAFLRAEERFERYVALELPRAAPMRYPRRFRRKLAAKRRAEGAYKAVLRLHSPRWKISAWTRLAQASLHLQVAREAVLPALPPTPASLRSSAAREAYVSTFDHGHCHDTWQGALESAAARYLRRCVALSHRHSLFTPWTRLCLTTLQRRAPADFPPLDELLPVAVYRRAIASPLQRRIASGTHRSR